MPTNNQDQILHDSTGLILALARKHDWEKTFPIVEQLLLANARAFEAAAILSVLSDRLTDKEITSRALDLSRDGQRITNAVGKAILQLEKAP